jgi:hypothetical protein
MRLKAGRKRQRLRAWELRSSSIVVYSSLVYIPHLQRK